MDFFSSIPIYVCFIVLEIKAELLRLPCKSYANFSVIKHDAALQGSVITTLLFLTDGECKSMCLLERRCKSFNKETGGDMKCELNYKTTEDRKDNVSTVARPGWTFKSTDYSFHLLGQMCEAKDPCPKGVMCRDTCECPGFQCHHCQAGRKGLRCDDDIDECVTGTHNCGVNGVCINNIGSFKCGCLSGYAWDGSSCSDTDECVSGSHNCSPNSMCRNYIGSFSCVCNSGHYFDGSSCSAIKNLALNKAASQSSTYKWYMINVYHFASLANNGDRDGDAYKKKCAITKPVAEPGEGMRG